MMNSNLNLSALPECKFAYGKQLVVNIDKTSIDTILDKYLCYYPKQFHFLLKERIETVLMEQQKKLFEK